MQNQLSWAKETESQGFNITSNTLDGEVDKAIINYAGTASNRFDCGWGLWSFQDTPIFIGSTTTKVITSTNKPVLLLR